MRGGYQEAIEGWSTGIELGGKPSSLSRHLTSGQSGLEKVQYTITPTLVTLTTAIRGSNGCRPAPLAGQRWIKGRAALGSGIPVQLAYKILC